MFSEDAGDTTIPSHIRLHLVTPKGYVTFGKPGFAAIRVTVPEAAVYEHDESLLWEVQIGSAWQSHRLRAKTEAQGAQALGNR